MPSIINGLFSGRSGISSHGTAIAVIGDNISNSSTTGFKSSRAEFSDLIAGGQTSGKVVGSGSSISSVNTIFDQGILEFTSRPLDMAIDGNGFFVLANGAGRFYTRAGNFKVDSAGFIVNQNGLAVLGFPQGGSGALEPININSVSQDSVATQNVTVSGNLNASVATLPVASIPDTATTNSPQTQYTDLDGAAEFSTVVEIFDSLGASHTLTFFFYHTDDQEYTVKAYVNSDEVDTGASPPTGVPREVASFDMTFGGDGNRTDAPAVGSFDVTPTITWNNGASASTVNIDMRNFTQFSSPSNVLSITQDGQGIGNVTSLNIEKDGDIFALLSNGQSATIGIIGLVNFANPEGLTRVGASLLQQSGDSGEPVVGTPQSGTLGTLQSGSLELSTVDIANEFVKLITLQRGFQANSRIITTINQLLSELIQLA